MSNHKDAGHGTTIIKRAHRRHEAHSGGAWKVAFADFTLALMALFMVLWVMNVTPEEERKRVAVAIGGKPMFEGGVGIFEQDARRPVVAPMVDIRSTRPAPRSKSSAQGRTIDSLEARRALAMRILHEARKQGMETDVGVTINDQGVRIAIHDSDNNGMFERRSDKLSASFVKLLAALVPVLDSVTNKMVIVGHTDATRFAGASAFSNNWSLSSRRALRARQLLLDGGIDDARLFQVLGMGDSIPAVQDNPEHGRNRRVELFLLTMRAEDAWRRQFRGEGVGVEQIKDGTAEPDGTAPRAATG
ncbi:flagellar motor protein MotB [Burkholderia sp. RF2-non_BP3]|uniref:flagellar motor protein MotB n=1 Tax=Burkholderia sp. RF2-non_BP3 TaxID=1637844 RepID=UPI000755E8C2|nr:flagellar motor protein MotB [Burkholderia sp. RF2-non_BP3]KUY54583.1 histidine kinase [Burkholderia sp. RF2-non_BP3]